GTLGAADVDPREISLVACPGDIKPDPVRWCRRRNPAPRDGHCSSRGDARWAHAQGSAAGPSDGERPAGGQPGVGVVRVYPQLIATRRQSAWYRERARAGGLRGLRCLGATDVDPPEIGLVAGPRDIKPDPVPWCRGSDAAP